MSWLLCTQIESSERNNEVLERDSFLRRYFDHAAQQTNSENYDREELIHVVLDLLHAGIATTSTTLLWMTILLANRTDYQVSMACVGHSKLTFLRKHKPTQKIQSSPTPQ